MPTRLTAAYLRSRAEWDVELEDGMTVRCRRLDLVTAYMTNLLPQPLMNALGRLRKHHELLQQDPTNILAIPAKDQEDTVALLRLYAVHCIIDPIFVLEDDDDPTHVPVAVLTSDQLLKVWQSRPEAKQLPEVSSATADAFRRAGAPHQDPAPLSDESEIPSAPELVSAGASLVEVRYH